MASILLNTAVSPALDDAINVNDVPMRGGDDSYSSHAELQREAALQTFPLLRRATEMAQKTSDRLTVIEYGSSHGNNTIEPLEAILPLTRASEVMVLLSDRPQNDFNTLTNTISAWVETRNSLFLAMVPRSFYRQVVPARSVDVGFSLSSLHHLDRLPENMDLLSAQAHQDFCLFLRLRAAEFVTGGSLVISMVGRSSSGRENCSGPIESCRRAMRQMVEAGVLPESVAVAFRIPTYARSVNEMRSSLQEMSDDWETVELREEDVYHPATTDFRRHRGQGEEVSRQYAHVIIEWLMAICAGYFLKAVQVGLPGPEYSDAAAERLLNEWILRTKQLYQEHHLDEPVYFCYFHALLRRN
ncbi:hypothetical protein CP533_6462 [Ophiocordyceps camponoti-saundersi (nom. inval.)]|nr:hypothetical protein CP533_6462 [Ophiocordyceps camponoti-saundersi (nom. inval.)]